MRAIRTLVVIASLTGVAHADLRFPTRRAELAGTWSYDGGIYIVNRDGRYTLTLSDGRSVRGRWSLAEGHQLEMTNADRKDVEYFRIVGYRNDDGKTTTLRLAGPSYAFTATPRKCPCRTLVRRQ